MWTRAGKEKILFGDMVEWYNSWLATKRSGFDSLYLHGPVSLMGLWRRAFEIGFIDQGNEVTRLMNRSKEWLRDEPQFPMNPVLGGR